jgi:hypothetical protein
MEEEIFKIQIDEWKKKSENCEVCGIFGCRVIPTVNCPHCGNWYCREHSTMHFH